MYKLYTDICEIFILMCAWAFIYKSGSAKSESERAKWLRLTISCFFCKVEQIRTDAFIYYNLILCVCVFTIKHSENVYRKKLKLMNR